MEIEATIGDPVVARIDTGPHPVSTGFVVVVRCLQDEAQVNLSEAGLRPPLEHTLHDGFGCFRLISNQEADSQLILQVDVVRKSGDHALLDADSLSMET